jgi:PadR family transcriptional regulator PadR
MDAGSDALSGSIPPGVDGEYKSETRIRLVGCSPRSPHPLLTLDIYICRLHEMKLRLSPQTLQVLDAFLQAPKDWIYGYDISRNTGLKSGTLYPILMRLAERKLLETSWEAAEVGKPPRHLYRLTTEGMRFAQEHHLRHATGRWARVAFSGVNR